jgi:hypothetical protein
LIALLLFELPGAGAAEALVWAAPVLLAPEELLLEPHPATTSAATAAAAAAAAVAARPRRGLRNHL